SHSSNDFQRRTTYFSKCGMIRGPVGVFTTLNVTLNKRIVYDEPPEPFPQLNTFFPHVTFPEKISPTCSSVSLIFPALSDSICFLTPSPKLTCPPHAPYTVPLKLAPFCNIPSYKSLRYFSIC